MLEWAQNNPHLEIIFLRIRSWISIDWMNQEHWSDHGMVFRVDLVCRSMTEWPISSALYLRWGSSMRWTASMRGTGCTCRPGGSMTRSCWRESWPPVRKRYGSAHHLQRARTRKEVYTEQQKPNVLTVVFLKCLLEGMAVIYCMCISGTAWITKK